jgi:RNA polymerase sigma-70 factor (ECF subfamily)
MLRPWTTAGVSMNMGIMMTLERHTDETLDLETIWAEVGGAMERFVRRRVGDPHQADDVVAEVMLRIHQNLGSLDDRERLTAWVFRIARNAITDHYRRTARRREVVAAEPEPGVASGADAWLDDQAATLAELASCIRPLVDALPDDYRRALVLTDLEGRSQVDAARMEGISVSGMKSRVQRGRRQFATLVKQCCDVTTDSRGELVEFHLRPDGCGCPPDADLRQDCSSPPSKRTI